MKQTFLFAFAIITLQLHAQLSRADQNKIDALFQTWNTASSPGAAVGIIQNNRLVYTKSYGMADLEHNVPITDSTIFYIGSVSKQFVATALLLLEEDGKVGLDDRIQKYLPDFPEYAAPITLRHLVHHTSGLRDNLMLWLLTGNDDLDRMNKEEMYQLIRRQKELNFTPGERHSYSNTRYFLLAMIIEKATGQSMADYAQKNIFGPLGMKSTFFGDDNSRIIKNRAFSYVLQDGRYKNQIMRYDLVGSGGVYSNIRDLYLWDQNFYNNKLGKKSAALIQKMQTPGVLNDGKSINYAFALQHGSHRDLKFLGHTGGFAGYRSFLLRFPEQRVSVIVLGNASNLSSRLPLQAAEVLLEKQMSPIPPAPQNNADNGAREEQKPYTVDNPKQYVGSYYSEELDITFRIMEEEGKLFYSIKSRKTPLQPHSQDLFLTNGGVQLKFERNASKEITGCSMDAGRIRNIKFKPIKLPM